MKVIQPIPFSTYQATRFANSDKEHTMKFNWRANWEILLVLVIIVVGIVITTIAAIKNKDKHLLTLPEETDFGQLLAGSGLSEANNSLPQQNDLQFTGDLDDQPTRRPSQVKSARPIGHSSARENHVSAASNDQQRGSAGAGRQSKSDDSATDYGRPGMPDHQLATAIPGQGAGGQESYDALSTEATPSQVRNGEPSGGYSSVGHHYHQQQQQHQHNHLNNHNHPHANGRHYSGSRRHLNRTAATQLNDDGQLVMQSPYNDPLGDPADLIDDIHTTRSSLAGSNEAYHGGKGSTSANGAQSTDQLPMSLQAPYGAMPTSSMNQLNQILLHNSNGKLDPSSSLLDADDLLSGPYSRLHPTSGSNNSNTNTLTDAILRDYNLASAISNANSSQSTSQLLSSAMLANLIGSPGAADASPGSDVFSQSQQQQSAQQQPQQQSTPSASQPANHHHRGYPSAWPISVLLSDLLKLTARPAQQLSNALTGGGGSGGGDQSNRGSILQQSRLPGPLLSLLQGFAPASGTSHELGPASHDASESSQHYHRVSMSPTDVHSILARSLTSSNVLPAFPAPKGTPQSWIPPTQGGSVDYSSASTRNADLIASNVAGFVRNSANQQLNHANEQSSHQYNTQQHDGYQRSSNDGTFFAQPGDSGQVNSLQQQNQANFGGAQTMDQQMPPQIDQSHHASHPQTNFPPLVPTPERSWASSNQPNGANGGVGLFSVGNNRQANNVQQSNNDIDFRQTGSFKQAGQQGALLPQNDYNNYMSFHQAGAGAVQPSLFNMATTSNNAINANTGQQQMMAHHKMTNLPGAYGQAPTMYSNSNNNNNNNNNNHNHNVNSNQPPSEMPVPLGYNSPLSVGGLSSQSQITAQPRTFEHTNIEPSSPKISLNVIQPSSQLNGATTFVKQQQQQQAQSRLLGNKQQVVNQQQHQQNQLVSGATKAHVLARRKRAVVSKTGEDMGREDEVMSSKYNTNDEEDDGDSRPISVVRPDGRPMNSGRIRGYLALANQDSMDDESPSSAENDRQVAQSQRSADHLDLKPRGPSSKSRYMASFYGNQNEDQEQKLRKLKQTLNREHNSDNMILNESGNFLEQKPRDRMAFNNKNSLDVAGSGLMSKLLSTASTNDDMEDDMEDDEDPASEKRKEELEDAEFGIVNEGRQNRPAPDGPSNGGSSSLDNSRHPDSNKSSMRPVEIGNSGSGTTDNEAYARRHQQRSDIEFYGHPGEETRQLKFGILGSGNYEVVNGGIYPEADESTAAVNSVANYVRKPMLSNLPKLLAGEPVNPQAAFMPGGRVGGFLRGASAPSSDELVDIMPADIGKHLSSPLLELIDANTGEQLFDPNLLAQLGSSGSSARTTHASREMGGNSQQDADDEQQVGGDDRKQRDNSLKDSKGPARDNGVEANLGADYKRNKKNRNKLTGKENQDDGPDGAIEETGDDHDGNEDHSNRPTKNKKNTSREPNEVHSKRLERQQSSVSRSKSQGTNQFNSYQILPSKKVTIFSDQDLDSAPSEQHLGAQTYQFPAWE